MNEPKYNLETRTLEFSKSVRDLVKSLPRTLTNIEYVSQLVRSSASIGANYVEANESLSKKDFIMRIKISRKEAKESIYWLELIESNSNTLKQKSALVQEATELMKIFSAIMHKSVQV